MKERLFSPVLVSLSNERRCMDSRRTGKLLCFFCWYSPQMPQITLVSHQHDHDVGISMIPEFLQPSLNILIRLVFADIVDE